MKVPSAVVFSLLSADEIDIVTGVLDPAVDYAIEPLVSMSPGSLYNSLVKTYVGGIVTSTVSILWRKTIRNSDCTIPSQSPWVPVGNLPLYFVTSAFDPAAYPYSAAPIGSIVIVEDTTGAQCGTYRTMYQKLRMDTQACDWFATAETVATPPANVLLEFSDADIVLTQTTDEAAIAWSTMNLETATVTLSRCDDQITPGLFEVLAPVTGLYQVIVTGEISGDGPALVGIRIATTVVLTEVLTKFVTTIRGSIAATVYVTAGQAISAAFATAAAAGSVTAATMSVHLVEV